MVDQNFQARLADGQLAGLKQPSQFVGFLGEAETPSSILLKNNELHIEIQVDSRHQIGATDRAGVKDIVLEAALTTIMDCEDSVAAVDAEDKALAYSNWMGLIAGTLEETIDRNGKTFVRSMNPHRQFKAADGSEISLSGRSLMFVPTRIVVTAKVNDPAARDGQADLCRRRRKVAHGIPSKTIKSNTVKF